MKKILKIALMAWLIVSCKKNNTKVVYNIPDFETNSTLARVAEPIRDVASEKDFTIAYTAVPYEFAPSEHTFKIFCLKDTIWEKIEIRNGITELDTVYSDSEGDIIDKQVSLRLECRKTEAASFLNKLLSYNLFTLADESELVKKCTEMRGRKIPEYFDIGYISLYIIQGSRVRNLNYHTYMLKEDCSIMKEWQDIESIKSVFRNEWYVKEH